MKRLSDLGSTFDDSFISRTFCVQGVFFASHPRENCPAEINVDGSTFWRNAVRSMHPQTELYSISANALAFAIGAASSIRLQRPTARGIRAESSTIDRTRGARGFGLGRRSFPARRCASCFPCRSEKSHVSPDERPDVGSRHGELRKTLIAGEIRVEGKAG